MTYLLNLIGKFCTKNSISAFFATFTLASIAYFTDNSISAFILFSCIWVFAFLTSAILVEENTSNLTKGLGIIYTGSVYMIATHYINIPKVDGNELHNLTYLFLQINSIMSPMIFSAIGGFLIVEHIKNINQKGKNINKEEDANKKGKGSSKKSSEPTKKADNKASSLLFLTLCFIALIYIIFMFAFPFYQEWHLTHNFAISWKKVQHILYDWQTINASLIALTSAIIFYLGTKKREDGRDKRERERLTRNLIASRAFLSHALSSIDIYLKSVCLYHEKIYVILKEKGDGKFNIADHPELSNDKPKILNGYEEIFRDFIPFSPKEILDYLVSIIGDLQVIEHRMFYNPKIRFPRYEVDNIINIVKTAIYINKIIPYARDGNDNLNISNPNKEDFNFYLGNLNLTNEELKIDLKEYIKTYLEIDNPTNSDKN